MQISYDTVIRALGNNTGIEVPAEVLDELGGGRRPPVKVTVGSYAFRGTVGSMSGLALISFSKAHRMASGLAGGDSVTVVLEVDQAPREVEVPPDLADALVEHGLTPAFEGLAASRRKEYVRQVNEAKAAQTRARRIDRVIADLTD